MYTLVLVSMLTSLLLAPPVFSQTLSEFDRPPLGRLDRDELEAIFLHYMNPPFTKIDKNRDGRITDDELQSFRNDVAFNIEELADKLKKGPPYTLDQVAAYLGISTGDRVLRPTPPPPPVDLAGILIRRTYEVITLGTPAKSFQNSQPAVFSYGRDFAAESDVWQARGVIMRPFRIAESAEGRQDLHVSGVSITPSVAFDRVKNSRNERAEISSLIPRLATEIGVTGGSGRPFEGQYFRVFGAYGTDFDFNASVGAVEFEWEPIPSSPPGFGVYAWLFGMKVVEYRLRAFAHAEYGHAFDSGNQPDLSEGEFLRIGPVAEVTLRLAQLPRLTVSGGVRYLYGLIGDPKNSLLWTAGVNFQVDERGHFNVTLEYENGRIPLLQDDSETLSLGLGIKF